MFAELFIKINIIDKTKITQIQKNKEKKDEFSLYHYSLPSSSNYDYTGVTDKTLGKISLNLNNLPKLSQEDLMKGNKFIRALFYVRLGQTSFAPTPIETNINNNDEIINRRIDPETKQEVGEGVDSQTIINIVITPGMNNFKYIEARPFEYYFSNLTYNSTSRSKQVETKVYSLTVENLYHDLLVIEISSCVGQYEINIQEELISKDSLNKPSIEYSETEYNGKKTIYIENIKSKHYYLSIKSKRDPFFCKLLKLQEENCGNDLSYLFYYYNAYSEHFSFQEVDKWISHRPYGKGRIKLELPIIITTDIEMNKKNINDYKFDVFATKNKDDTNKMGSVCYLSRVISNKTKIFKIESMTVENNSALILKDLEPGNRYYINVLAQNIKTKELITFHPIEVFTGGVRPVFWRYLSFFIILLLFVILAYYIHKYRKTKDELIFLKGDALPKTENDIKNMGYEAPSVKYTGLGSGY